MYVFYICYMCPLNNSNLRSWAHDVLLVIAANSTQQAKSGP